MVAAAATSLRLAKVCVHSDWVEARLVFTTSVTAAARRCLDYLSELGHKIFYNILNKPNLNCVGFV